MARYSRRAFIKTGLVGGAALAGIAEIPAKWLNRAEAKAVYGTTLERTVMPVPVPVTSPKLLPTEVAKFAQYGYGAWKEGAGIGYEKRLDLMPATYSGAPVSKALPLVRFFTISDIHITDKESPAQAIYLGLKDGINSAYSPVMPYTTHVLNAAVQTVNALHKQSPIDFGISLGDACNSSQYNELRWYIDILDGKEVVPSSGAHAGADSIDYQKPYRAAGLDKSIPWYQTIGNHDHFWMGTAPLNDYLRQAYIGDEILNLGDVFRDPRGLDSRGFYMGTLDGRTPNGAIVGIGPVADFSAPPKVVADPDRRSLSRQEWIKEFFHTASYPVGHGFNRSNVEADFACYSFAPKSDLPLKVIVLDDTQREDDANTEGYKWHGAVDQKRYEWLVNELDQGQAQGQLMIIAAHIPIGVEKPGAFMSWWEHAYISETALFAKLHEYPNLLMWTAGHRHFNTVTAFKSPDPDRPELGFWQVETSSLRDFPQQFRTFEIVSNSDNTISIFATNVDPAFEPQSPAAKSRSNAIAANQLVSNPAISSNPGLMLPTGAYNAELVKQLSIEMQVKIRNYATLIRQI